MATGGVSVEMNKSLITIVAVIMVLVFVPVIVWQLNYVDETLTAGEGYGFVIGESKQDCINRIKQEASKRKYMAVQLGDSPKDFKVIYVGALQISNLKSYDSWVVMLDSADSFLNTIKLDFKNARLTSIHRHKQLFELP